MKRRSPMGGVSKTERPKRIRVAHVTDGSRWAGIEANLYNLQLAARDDPRLELFFVFTEEGEPARRLREVGGQVIVLKGSRFKQLLALRRQFATIQPDVLHLHGYLGVFLGVLASLGSPIVRLATLHGAIEPEQGPSTRLFWYARSALIILRLSGARFLAVSEAIAEDWISYGVSKSRLSVVHNGVVIPTESVARRELRARGPIQGQLFRIGIVGRLVHVKDHKLFLHVAREVANHRQDVEFLIIGEGFLEDELKKEQLQLGLCDQVKFLGFRPDAKQLIENLDVLLFTSRSEGIPFALLEAMSAGVPIVAPRVGGIPEVVTDGQSGLISPTRDSAELVRRILKVLDDHTLRMMLSAGAVARVREEFSATGMLERTLEAYWCSLAAPGEPNDREPSVR
ncbi:MAG: glycosyltransferase [Myxococcota bacterium]|nr:glycosyltransferase [Myxococcota bacterium]